MARKIAVMVVFAMALIFAQNQAEAAEVHIGNYSDGSAVYLITESVIYLYGKSGARLSAVFFFPIKGQSVLQKF